MGGAFAFLIGSRRETPNEVRLVRLLEFYGVRCLAVRGVSASSIVNEVEAQARRVGVAGPVCAIMSGEVMGEPLADGNEAYDIAGSANEVRAISICIRRSQRRAGRPSSQRAQLRRCRTGRATLRESNAISSDFRAFGDHPGTHGSFVCVFLAGCR